MFFYINFNDWKPLEMESFLLGLQGKRAHYEEYKMGWIGAKDGKFVIN